MHEMHDVGGMINCHHNASDVDTNRAEFEPKLDVKLE